MMPQSAGASTRGRGSAQASSSSSSRVPSGKAKRPQRLRVEVVLDPGPDLFSQGPTSQVSSALVGLTTVFGMGTGVTPPLQGPRRQLYQRTRMVGKAAHAIRSLVNKTAAGSLRRPSFERVLKKTRAASTYRAGSTTRLGAGYRSSRSTVSADQLQALRLFHLPSIKHVLYMRSYLITQRVSSSRGALPT